MVYQLRIIDMPETERPRERLAALGSRVLSSAELLAILLGTGQGAGKLSAVGLGHLILKEFSAFNRDPIAVLREASLTELTQIHGIGPAKATTILAAIELGKRAYQFRPTDKIIVNDPSIAAAALSGELMWRSQERFAVVLLDITNAIMGSKVVTIGTATETLAHPREIFREAIKQGAAQIIIAHNHPSGSLEPSREDIDLTKRLLEVAEIVAIPVLDHLILGKGDFVSLREKTALWNS